MSEEIPERLVEIIVNAKVGELVQRLLSAGDLYIDRGLHPESGETRYLVKCRDEWSEVEVWERALVDALKRADENVSLLSCS